MSDKVSRSPSVRTRIYISTGLLVGVCCIASGIGWFGQTSLLSNIEDYEQAELVSSRVLEIDRNVQELKARSESYIHSGTQSTRRAAERLLQNLISQIGETQELSGSLELTDMLDEMQQHLQMFGDQLSFAAEERGLRTTLVDVELPSKANEVQAAIAQLKASIGQSQSNDASAILVDVVQAFDQGRNHLLQYLLDPDASQLENMLAALQRAEEKVKSIEVADSVPIQEHRELLTQRFTEFQVLSLRAVQATRGYLYYSNVVMAGAISEFVYYSNQVKQFVHGQQQLNRTARTSAANRTRTLSVFASLVALLFAGFLATGLSYSIIGPISRLTDAFRRLAGGETLGDIPGTDRSDEIGRMSRAAQVFSAKNQETQDLLAQSQSLSKELTAKAKALEETNRELDNFAYVASHDLKAPLRGINSLAEWVHEDCRELLPEDSIRHLTQMQNRVHKMESLLNELLEYSRVGKTEQHADSIDLHDMVRSIIDITDNPTRVNIQITSRLPRVKSAIAPLRQVLLNLITNAIKYNDKGEQGKVEISCADEGDRLRISITDNGMGIEPRYHERIFQMYQRIAPKNIEGSGMGLAIVKKQVEHHGGSVTVESKLQRGTKFTFTWAKQVEPSSDGRKTIEPRELVES